MAFDYSSLLATALLLITDFGRAVTLRRESDTPADPTRPWGPSDTTASDVQAVAAIAVFLDVENDAWTTTGAGIGRGSTAVDEKKGRVLVTVVSLPEELDPSWQIDDGTRTYEITSVKAVKPGGTLLYYDVEIQV